MITIFNRAEIATTIDLEQQNKIRNLLSQNNIEYDVKTKNNATGFFGTHQRTYLTDPTVSVQHTFYVQKKDYELAVDLLKQL